MTNEELRKIKIQTHKNKEAIKTIKAELKPGKPRTTVRIKSKEIVVRKPKVVADLPSKVVLTDSTWQFVEIYLRSEGQNDALFYWEQARNFYESTKTLSLVSKPLTAYYCFLNATKALLEVKKVGYDLSHGVTGKQENGHIRLQNEIVKFQPAGVVSGLGIYLGEHVPAGGQQYTLKDIFYNIPYIHRAFTITYKNIAELFIPIMEPRFVFDRSQNKGWLEIKLEKEHSNPRTLRRLQGYSLDPIYDNSVSYTLRRNKKFDWVVNNGIPSAASIKSLQNYHQNRRKELRYIFSPNSLWYVKRKDLQNNIIDKSTLTLTIGAMHRLSELSRYNPQTLSKHLEKDGSWLITEFINKSIYQFIDQISSEITGNDFRVTGFRD
ncbi:YaaC family protein [Aeromonas sp. R9-2]|uniref:YaaC family protein n=1 Tax=Aeromonas sp. R9-2 TaxID=3138479 RepID=UPI0034A4A980